jgi:porin
VGTRNSPTRRKHIADFAIYGVADQMIYRDSDDADRTVSTFVRAMGTPQSDRNDLVPC